MCFASDSGVFKRERECVSDNLSCELQAKAHAAAWRCRGSEYMSAYSRRDYVGILHPSVQYAPKGPAAMSPDLPHVQQIHTDDDGQRKDPAHRSPHTLITETTAASFSSRHQPRTVRHRSPVAGVHWIIGSRRLAPPKINLDLSLGIVMRSKAGRHRKGGDLRVTQHKAHLLRQGVLVERIGSRRRVGRSQQCGRVAGQLKNGLSTRFARHVWGWFAAFRRIYIGEASGLAPPSKPPA